MNKDIGIAVESNILTLEPYEGKQGNSKSNMLNSSILLVKHIPLSWSFDIIYAEFSKFGSVIEIRNQLGEKYESFNTWIIFDSSKDAANALREFSPNMSNFECSLVKDFPGTADIFRPLEKDEEPKYDMETFRSPNPPRWLILTTRSDRGNLFKVKKFINQKLGHVKRPDISRFGRSSFLLHAKSDGQAAMLLNMKLDPEDFVKEVKPHYNFSYARGVIFNEDLYDMNVEEILEMCPVGVWKIFKIPRSSMIILTFRSSDLPTEIIVDHEFIRVRPYRPRPLQCFNCFGYGHASRVCTRGKICQSCSEPEHGDCTKPKVCVNCKAAHHARDKNCTAFKKEQEALLKAEAEHISIGHAKKLLSKTLYSDILKDKDKSTKPSLASASRPSKVAPVGSLHDSSGGASQAPSAGASQALLAGAPRVSSDGASLASSSGALQVPSVGNQEKSSAEVRPVSSRVPQGDSDETDVWYESQDLVDSGTHAGSLRDHGVFSLSGSLPDIESSRGPIVTVHRPDANVEMEALSVGQKRARTPSPHSSSRSLSRERNKRKEGRLAEQPLSKKSTSEIADKGNKKDGLGNKISLSRSSIPRPQGENKRVPKSK